MIVERAGVHVDVVAACCGHGCVYLGTISWMEGSLYCGDAVPMDVVLAAVLTRASHLELLLASASSTVDFFAATTTASFGRKGDV